MYLKKNICKEKKIFDLYPKNFLYKNMKIIISFIIFFVWIQVVYSFNYPLKIKPGLAATFGEFRNGHYHAGLDLKTYGRMNIPIYAIDDGYIARIKVSPFGYGKVVYQKLQNGQTAVYAHCNKFNKKLENYIFKLQIKNKTFAIDLYFKKNQFPVKKGDIIAYSGRSGTIHPHLHFEIRNSKNQPINPLNEGFNKFFNDNNPPIIKKILISPLSADTKINFQTNPLLLKNNELKNDTIFFYGKIGIKALIYDFPSKKTNKNNIYAKYLLINNDTIYKKSFDIIDFSENYKVDFENILNPVDNKIYQLFYDFNSKHGIINSKYLYEPANLKLIVKDFYNNKNSYSITLIPVENFHNIKVKINHINNDTIFYSISNNYENLSLEILSYNPITKKYKNITNFNNKHCILNETFIYTGQRIIIFNFKYKNFIVKKYQFNVDVIKKFKTDITTPSYKITTKFFDDFIKLTITSSSPITHNILQINKLSQTYGDIINLNTIEFNIDYFLFSKLMQNNLFIFNNYQFYSYIIKAEPGDETIYTYLDSLLYIKISKNDLIKESIIFIDTINNKIQTDNLKQVSSTYSIKPFYRFCKTPIMLLYTSNQINNKCGFYYINNNITSYIPSTLKNNQLKCNIKKGGYIAILADTIPPEITPINFRKSIHKNKILKIKLSDIGSGINYKKINVTLNNNFVIPEYDGPRKTLLINLSKYKIKKKNSITVKVSDYNNNISQKTFLLRRK